MNECGKNQFSLKPIGFVDVIPKSFFFNLWIVVLEMQPIEYSHVEKELQWEVENSA
jgi:hypothetical protein